MPPPPLGGRHCLRLVPHQRAAHLPWRLEVQENRLNVMVKVPGLPILEHQGVVPLQSLVARMQVELGPQRRRPHCQALRQ